MNIIQAFVNIMRNINYYRPNLQNSYKETSILAAIDIGKTTPIDIENATNIPRDQIRKIAKQLTQENLIILTIAAEWPYRTNYALTPKGEEATTKLLNYKNKPYQPPCP